MLVQIQGLAYTGQKPMKSCKEFAVSECYRLMENNIGVVCLLYKIISLTYTFNKNKFQKNKNK
jgi:hypothetical protein